MTEDINQVVRRINIKQVVNNSGQTVYWYANIEVQKWWKAADEKSSMQATEYYKKETKDVFELLEWVKNFVASFKES